MDIPARELTGRVRDLLDQANVRRITIRDLRGNAILELPANAATTGPALIAVEALSGALAHFSVGVERTERTARAATVRTGEATGATEDTMNTRQTLGQRIDRHGTKIEDLAGTGETDTQGG